MTFRLPTRPGYFIFWDSTEERINRRTGKPYTKNVPQEFRHKDRDVVEAKKAELEADGFTVKGVYEGFY